MKNKRIFSFLVVMLLLITLLGGCKTEESMESALPTEEQQQSEEMVSSQQWRDISVAVYPADLQFTEYAELTISDKLLISESEDKAPDEDTKSPTWDGPQATKQSDDSTVISDNNSLPKQNEGNGSTGDISVIRDSENASCFMVFCEEKTDMTKGTAFYRIQVQKKDDEGTTIFTGSLFPGESVEWDESEITANSDVLLKASLSDVLLGDIEWISCTQAGVYAYNQNLTRCNLSGRNVIYTNDDYTVFQVQSYDDNGTLYCITEVSQNSAKILLNQMVGPISWSDDIYPVMNLSVKEEPVSEIGEIEEQIDAYEDQIIRLRQLNEQGRKTAVILSGVLMLLVVSNAISLVFLFRRKKRKSKKAHKRERTESSHEAVGKVRSVGTVHNIGSRSGQQDSFDVINCGVGTLAVVADGMGGLTDGDKVSQKIVATMRADAARIRHGQTDKILCQMVAHANQEVNRMLGTARQYKCGSTLLAVLIENGTIQWISVGDSRIYLYRGGSLIQINREHIYSAELLERAINGKIGFGEALHDPQAERLSSFIGMGELKHVDICLHRLKLCMGDRILLMSDGMFNTLSNEEISYVIQSSADASSAAAQLEQKVLQKNAPNQDNFTCVILEI